MAVVFSTEILLTACQGTRCYNLEDYNMNALKMREQRMSREVFGREENKHDHEHNRSPRE